MRNIIASIHTSLDGYMAGLQGEINWIRIDEEIFDWVGAYTQSADTALYGRRTFEMMQAYWPQAANKPNASQHDKEHSAWYNAVDKLVLSNTLRDDADSKIKILQEDAAELLRKEKEKDGKSILLFGSMSVVHWLFEHKLLDELRLLVNPILLGNGIPLFPTMKHQTPLTCVETKPFGNGVIGLHYKVTRLA